MPPASAGTEFQVGDIIESESGNYVSFEDPDGNPIYVGDWDPDFDKEHEPNAVGAATRS